MEVYIDITFIGHEIPDGKEYFRYKVPKYMFDKINKIITNGLRDGEVEDIG